LDFWCLKRANELRRGAFFMRDFCLGEEEFLEFELEILCMGEEEQAASFVGQQLEAACIPYLLERLQI
jgi:hypothetical protein